MNYRLACFLLRAYKLLLDGNEVASIDNGETVTVQADPGPHTIQMKIDWCRSPSITVDVPAGGTVRLRWRPNANPVTALYYIAGARGRYIRLWSE